MNTLFPGRPGYTGPASGIFGLLHHDVLVETSHNVNDRIAYVTRAKPRREVAIRLYNMIYLGNCKAAVKRDALYADYEAKRALLYADYETKWASLDADDTARDVKGALLYADYEAKRVSLYVAFEAKRDALASKVTAYIKKHIPDTAWNGSTLVF